MKNQKVDFLEMTSAVMRGLDFLCDSQKFGIVGRAVLRLARLVIIEKMSNVELKTLESKGKRRA